jgi:hypothetical protein
MAADQGTQHNRAQCRKPFRQCHGDRDYKRFSEISALSLSKGEISLVTLPLQEHKNWNTDLN